MGVVHLLLWDHRKLLAVVQDDKFSLPSCPSQATNIPLGSPIFFRAFLVGLTHLVRTRPS